MVAYSPIASTYGVRIEQVLETDTDFAKYHIKLNKKLRQLRHRCQLVTKDTKKYTNKEKYSKITSDDYDKKNKLFGVLVLLHAERDLSLAETLKTRIRQRGKAKDSEKKVLSTRLKKAYKTAQNLVELTKNEAQWITRIQYLAYAKLVHVEYLLFGKQIKTKNSAVITRELSLALAACTFLRDQKILPADIIDFLNSKYEYTLGQHGGNMLSATDIHNFIVQTVEIAKNENDELALLLFNNGYTVKLEDVKMDGNEINDRIQWRSFNCKIKDNQIAQLIHDVKVFQIKDISDYSTKLSKWEGILAKQEDRIEHVSSKDFEDDDDEDINGEENEQILLAYIKYQTLFISITRDTYLFHKLWKQWTNLGSSMSSKLTKYKEIERMVKNLKNYLKEVTELPGVYSDDDLLYQLELSIIYFKIYLSAGCLAALYQTKGNYREALALYINSYQTLEAKLQDNGDIESIVLPEELLSKKKLEQLQNLIKTGWKSVIALAEYEKELNNDSVAAKYKPTVIEKVDSSSVKPCDVQLNNLFPRRPMLKPVSAKPTLFDLAFNYIDYSTNPSSNTPEVEAVKSKIKATPAESQEEEPTKKRGFLGLFGR